MMNFRCIFHLFVIATQVFVFLQFSVVCGETLELAPGQDVGEVIDLSGGSPEDFYLKILTGIDIENFTLIPDVTYNWPIELGVISNGEWQIMAKDANNDQLGTGGKMTKYKNNQYVTTTQLENPLKVYTDLNEVTLPEEDVILMGCTTFRCDDKMLVELVTFEQTITWKDENLPNPYNYRIDVAFTGQASV